MTTTTTSRTPSAVRRSRSRDHVGPDERIFNLNPSVGTERNWSVADVDGRGPLEAPVPPSSVDLRADWWTVGDQGRTGSCVGWAAADGVGRRTMVDAGRITQDCRLSPRFTWMGSKESDEFVSRPTGFVEGSGTSLKAAMDVSRTFGFALESDLPFDIDTTMFLGNENAFYAGIAQRRISYVDLAADRVQWRLWLARGGPILAGFSVDDAFTSVGSDGLVGTFDSATVRGGHAVCIVGYRADGRFIVRNSWGTGWGDAGFAYVTEEYLSAAFYPESYGAVVS
ncbi:C1 family peptidase [Rhodococcus sp. BP-241]|uniref:C1 family peptidase n=1 Tax=Rhodococcus sp. BP-241 TaxID=2739441 RepID=UPI001C9A9273|nr:C1 family peptidase [Rhodococcus sp. BP-241]MBY6707220.1 C1 family peptidase [Rhodococcus sp. BP-241]